MSDVREAGGPAPVNVLIVDDDPETLESLAGILEGLGQNLVPVRSGEEALARLVEGEFAVVLLDVRMKGMDGFATAERIRRRQRSRHTPIIFLSGFHDNRLAVEEIYALGAVDYLVKPVIPAVLRAKVAAFVELQRNAQRLRELEAKAERARGEAEAQLRLMLESVRDYAIFAMDLAGRVTTWNPGAERLFGYAPGEIIGRDSAVLFTPEDRAAGEQVREMTKALQTGRGEDERWHLRKDGSRFFASGVLTPIRDGVAARGFTKVARDVTEQMRAAEALRDREAMLRTLGDNLPGAIYQAHRPDPDGPTRFRYVSAGIEALCGITPAQAVADPGALFGLIVPEDLPRVLAADAAAAANGTPFDVEFRQRNARGDVIWVHCRSSPRQLADGTFVYDGIVMDVTARRRAEEALREADKRKDEFLATLAHELRNPLAPVRNALEILKRTNDPAAAVEARAMMERQLRQMVRLIDDLLDVSRITRGKLELRREPIDLRGAAAQAVEAARPALEAGGHELSVDLGGEPLPVFADATRLAQVLVNLLNNAAKYTERGGKVALAVSREGSEAVARVRDTGVGIPAEMLGPIFEPFVQADRSLERAQGGLGIGLTLVKRILDLHGGAVEARSDGPGCGSEFIVRLPLADAPTDAGGAGAGEAEMPGNPASLRVLVVDDNRDAADSLAVLLEFAGHEARVAHGGEAALRLFEAVRPHVVLADISMPGMSGHELARRLRQRPGGERVLLIATSGYGQEEDRKRSREAGFDGHLVKPIDLHSLNDHLRRHVPPT
jgi:PAS domain S-box-containing protein